MPQVMGDQSSRAWFLGQFSTTQAQIANLVATKSGTLASILGTSNYAGTFTPTTSGSWQQPALSLAPAASAALTSAARALVFVSATITTSTANQTAAIGLGYSYVNGVDASATTVTVPPTSLPVVATFSTSSGTVTETVTGLTLLTGLPVLGSIPTVGSVFSTPTVLFTAFYKSTGQGAAFSSMTLVVIPF